MSEQIKLYDMLCEGCGGAGSKPQTTCIGPDCITIDVDCERCQGTGAIPYLLASDIDADALKAFDGPFDWKAKINDGRVMLFFTEAEYNHLSALLAAVKGERK